MAVSLTRAKPIDTLYDEVSGYDLVIVPDRPYARALNRHLDQPQVGPFATTPRQLVAGERDERDDRFAFLELVDELSLPWKQTAHLIGEVLQCWEHQGSPQAIYDYDRFDTPAVRQVVEGISTLDTRAKRLEDFEIEDDTSVAVVGYDQLTELQRSILPADADSVGPFLDSTTSLPQFQLVESATSMINLLQETVARNHPEDIAIVLEEGSRYNTLVEAAFDAADIPYHGGPGFTDEPSHRAMLRLLRLSHVGRALTIGDVRPILARLGTVPPIEHDNKRLDGLDLEEAAWIRRTLPELPESTLREAIDRFADATGESLTEFEAEMERLGLIDAQATQETIDRLTFYLQTYDIPIEREDRGVTLASATNSSYVDRPLVIYLALDQGWTREAPSRPWVDSDAFFDRDLKRFQLLLQSGSKQQYLVQDVAGGEPIIPCLYLDTLSEDRIQRFRDLADGEPIRPFRTGGSGFDIDTAAPAPPSYGTISQSSLNTFVHSPRDWAFGQLVGSPDEIALEEGTLVHHFAEFAIANPEFVDEDAVSTAVEFMANEMAPFYDAGELDIRRTSYHAWFTTLASYAREVGSEPLSSPIGSPSTGQNPFAELFDRPVTSDRTERWFEEPALGIKGKIDLVRSDGQLVDFKRSSRKTAGSLVRSAELDPPDDQPNFQTPLYLTYLRQQLSERNLSFTFLYLRELVEDALTGDIDIADGQTTIEYHPIAFAAFVRSETAFRALAEDSSKKSQKTFKQVSFERYRHFWDDQSADILEGELDADPLRSELESMLVDEVGDYKYVRAGTGQALRYLRRVRDSTFFADDLDAFEAFVDGRLEDLNRYLAGEERFPKRGLVEELNDRRLNHPDLLLDHA